ncbi:hypothetical protein ARMGADRAFT_1088499 [Armillaria gallica]|uniref:Uncharacterized protein n=1 Tax=Armillaria gallica TaxID=47427 RepID=A0A2H3CMG2_ARMGA|nr:hypothetical protein ARMGADRAFT_1088499 [Armillaria gallica]
MSFVPTRPGTAYLCPDSGVTRGSDLKRRWEAMTGAVSSPVLICTVGYRYVPFLSGNESRHQEADDVSNKPAISHNDRVISYKHCARHGIDCTYIHCAKMNWKRLVLPGISAPFATTPLGGCVEDVGREERPMLCSTSTECTRYITHLLRNGRGCTHGEERVQNTTTFVVRAGRWIRTKVDQRQQNLPFPFTSSLARFDVELTRRFVWWVQHGIFESTLHPSLCQPVALKLYDDLNFPSPSLRHSKQLPVLKISCAVLDLTKGVDRNVWGTGAKPHLPQLYSRFLSPYWTASAAFAMVVGVRLSLTARLPVPVYRAIQVAHGSLFVLVRKWKGTIESVATARYELLGAWNIFQSLTFGATVFSVRLRRLSIPQQILVMKADVDEGRCGQETMKMCGGRQTRVNANDIDATLSTRWLYSTSPGCTRFIVDLRTGCSYSARMRRGGRERYPAHGACEKLGGYGERDGRAWWKSTDRRYDYNIYPSRPSPRLLVATRR